MLCDGPLRRGRRGLGASSSRAAFAWSIATVLAVPVAASGHQTGTTAPIHLIPRLEEDIAFDGTLDEPAWSDAWTYELGYEVKPAENAPAPVRTEVLVFHDLTHLYVGFRAFDPDPSQIRAHLSDRDAAWADDWVGVVLDTFNDERRDYLLVVNPRTVVFVGCAEDSRGDSGYDLTTASRSVFAKLGYAWVP